LDGELPLEDLGEMRVVHHHLSDELPAPAQPVAAPEVVQRLPDDAEVWHALVLGLRDYVRKNGFRSVVFGLSGGIDSSVVAAIAVDAIGPSNVYGVSMPSRYSSDPSSDNDADIAQHAMLDYLQLHSL